MRFVSSSISVQAHRSCCYSHVSTSHSLTDIRRHRSSSVAIKNFCKLTSNSTYDTPCASSHRVYQCRPIGPVATRMCRLLIHLLTSVVIGRHRSPSKTFANLLQTRPTIHHALRLIEYISAGPSVLLLLACVDFSFTY